MSRKSHPIYKSDDVVHGVEHGTEWPFDGRIVLYDGLYFEVERPNGYIAIVSATEILGRGLWREQKPRPSRTPVISIGIETDRDSLVQTIDLNER
jgi:hypothetical protein